MLRLGMKRSRNPDLKYVNRSHDMIAAAAPVGDYIYIYPRHEKKGHFPPAVCAHIVRIRSYHVLFNVHCPRLAYA